MYYSTWHVHDKFSVQRFHGTVAARCFFPLPPLCVDYTVSRGTWIFSSFVFSFFLSFAWRPAIHIRAMPSVDVDSILGILSRVYS